MFFALILCFIPSEEISIYDPYAFLRTVQIKTFIFSPPKAYSEPRQRSKKELFAEIVKGFLFSKKSPS